VDGAGDVDDDGLADVAVGSFHSDFNGQYSGRVYVVFGKTDTNAVALADIAAGSGGFVLDGEAREDGVGRSVSGAGDMNGDGLADLLVPARGFPDMTRVGRTHVVFSTGGTDSPALSEIAAGSGGFALDGEHEGDDSGYRVDDAGDVNGDGVGDLLITAPNAAPNGPYSGRTYVVFGGDFSCEGG
jgi:hypothetical protein